MHILVTAEDDLKRIINTALVRQIKPGKTAGQVILEFGPKDVVVVNLPMERFATKLHAFPIEV